MYNDVHCVEIDTGKGASVHATKACGMGRFVRRYKKNTEYTFAL